MRRVALVAMAAVIVSVLLASEVATISVAAPGATNRMSVSSSGAQGNKDSDFPSITPDGRFVAFTSHAPNLVPGDTNGDGDVFVRDRQRGPTQRVSVSSSGAQGERRSIWSRQLRPLNKLRWALRCLPIGDEFLTSFGERP